MVAEQPKAKRTTWTRPTDGTLGSLFDRYYQSAEFKRLNVTTQHVRRLIFHIHEAAGRNPYRLLETKHAWRMRDLKADRPEAANGQVKALRAVFSWAVPGVELAERNPAKDVPYIEAKGDGHHSWTDAEVAQYEARHPVSTTARLAMALLLFTSQRRSDIVLFGPNHVRAGWLDFTQQKNRDRNPIYLEIAIWSEFQDILDATPLGADTFLINAFSKPFSVAGFGNWFPERCDKAGLNHCSVHGLRKAAARRLAENDRSSHQIMAITGHTTLREVDRYTRAANQRKLAGQASSQGNQAP